MVARVMIIVWDSRRARIFIVLVILLTVCIGIRADVLMDSDQTVYGKDIRTHSVTGSGDRYVTVTGRVLMNGTLAAPVQLFSDIEGSPGWIEDLAAVKVIGSQVPTNRTIYMRFSAPPGFADRDGLMRFVVTKEAQNILILTFDDVPGFPLNSDAVRMSDVRGKFRIEQVTPGTMAVEFRLYYDSNAKPVFLANLRVRHQVDQTLVRMRQRIEGPLRNAQFDGALARALGLE